MTGRQYWRSLEELARTRQFTDMRHREFPPGASEWEDGLSRRNFLKLSGVSLALAGLTACTKQPPKEILPYVNQPEGLTPGEPLFYATAMVHQGFATGVLVKSREGHPIKIEGNPLHPSNRGASSIWMQASLWDLYDPDRSKTVLHQGEISTWNLFLSDLNDAIREEGARTGRGLRVLTESVISPTLNWQLEQLLKKFPEAKWHQYEPLNRDNSHEGARLAFGEIVETHYSFDKAAMMLSLDSDFLYTHPDSLRYARQFTDARRVATGKKEMNRLYVVESCPTVTGSMAEHRLPLRSSEVLSLTVSLSRLLGLQVSGHGENAGAPTQWMATLAQDLQQYRGGSIIIAGENQPPMVHALAHAFNQHLGNTGQTVFYAEPAQFNPGKQTISLRELVHEMGGGRVETLFILGGNPVFNAPIDLSFAEALQKVRRSIHLGDDLNETAAAATWHIPQAHYLESWSDARAFDGTVSILQPLIEPLYNGKTAQELLGIFSQQQPIRSDYEIVREFWRGQNLWPEFEKGWRKALHDGLIEGTALQRRDVRVNLDALRAPLEQSATTSEMADSIELNFRPDPSIWDGRFANNGWLQECPRPISKLTWDNAALVSPGLARAQKLDSGDIVELQFDGRKLKAPVWIMPGHADGSVTVHLGYGRSRVGRVGSEVGFNAYELRDATQQWFGRSLKLVKLGEKHRFAATQTHHHLEGDDRQVYRAGALQDYLSQPEFIKKSVEAPERERTLYEPDEFHSAEHRWGMSIDLTTCLGCNACLVACEVENNIPVVGKEQVARHREMFWIRVDTYFEGAADNPRFHHMPVPCMHCEHAPCELVCPVAATVHDHEGLNLQVYNRCVGTRFCSNNCPYKVRRFNFYQYTKYHEPSFKPMYNPEVTVRWRGVMEKCTYCIKRISRARITAEKENRRIRDGEVQTACQQACPAEAIIFGDLNDPASKLARYKKHPLDYPMLGQLNTRPRTTYLAKVVNPNPILEKV